MVMFFIGNNYKMGKIDIKTYKLFMDEDCVSQSKIPLSVQKTNIYQQLLENNILNKTKKGRGFNICINKPDEFGKFFKSNFPNSDINVVSRADNIRKYRDSKASPVKNRNPIFFFRGFDYIVFNRSVLNLQEMTKDFGLFACREPIVSVDNICFVENLETFLHAEKLFGEQYLFIHKYGRIGKESLKTIISKKKVMVFSDYDYVGLNEFLTIKEVYPNAQFFIPADYEKRFQTESVKLKERQVPTKKLKECKIAEIVKIREQIKATHKFLEQEALIDD